MVYPESSLFSSEVPRSSERKQEGHESDQIEQARESHVQNHTPEVRKTPVL